MKKEMSEKLISIRRHIHSNPELGGEEFATTAFVEKILSSLESKNNNTFDKRCIFMCCNSFLFLKINGINVIRTTIKRDWEMSKEQTKDLLKFLSPFEDEIKECLTKLGEKATNILREDDFLFEDDSLKFNIFNDYI